MLSTITYTFGLIGILRIERQENPDKLFISSSNTQPTRDSKMEIEFDESVVVPSNN